MRTERSDDEVRLALLQAAMPTAPPDPLAFLSVSEVAELSGVPGSTLAYQFDTPEDLRSEVYDEILSRFDVTPSVAIHSVVCDVLATSTSLAESVATVMRALGTRLVDQPTTRWLLGAASRPTQRPVMVEQLRRHGDDVARLIEQLAAARGLRVPLDRARLGGLANVALIAAWVSTTFSPDALVDRELDDAVFEPGGLLLWSRLRTLVEAR